MLIMLGHPEIIATLIYKIINSKNPKIHYKVGTVYSEIFNSFKKYSSG